jgi:hypothetical protein
VGGQHREQRGGGLMRRGVLAAGPRLGKYPWANWLCCAYLHH